MLLLYILFGVFFSAMVVMRFVRGEFTTGLPGRLALSAVLVTTATGHFLYTGGLAMMMPASIAYKTEWVYATGVLEYAAAAGLLVPRVQKITARLLMLFFVLVLPCNILAAKYGVDYRKADLNGPGIGYLWFRIPLQLFLIGWAYYFGVYKAAKNKPGNTSPTSV